MKLWSASMTMGQRRLAQVVGTATLLAVTVPFVSTMARADCQEDINGIMKRRLGVIATINASAKKNGGKLDPVSACPQFRGLAAIESEASAYFAKNGEWCNLPPDYAQKMTEARAKTSAMATRACQAVVMMKKMKQQQATQAAEALPKLPSGPL